MILYFFVSRETFFFINYIFKQKNIKSPYKNLYLYQILHLTNKNKLPTTRRRKFKQDTIYIKSYSIIKTIVSAPEQRL
jgi:hypothetical protein